MCRTFFKTNLVFLFAVVLIPGIFSFRCYEYDRLCLYQKAYEEKREKECLDNVSNYCNGRTDCKNGIDEEYCNSRDIIRSGGCPSDRWTCRDRERCIPMKWRCNNYKNCLDGSDEVCGNKEKLIKWLSDDWSTRRKGDELYLTAVALSMSDENYFLIGPYPYSKGKYMAEKVKSQLLLSLTSEGDLKSNELALKIHALLVTCNDPWDFYGFNLVSELRARVELDSSRPFELLALCNARDVMTPQDAQRAADAFHSKERRFTRDEQALALLALACIRTRTNFTLNGTNMSAMVEELKQGQFTNGSMGSLRTTALVLQALIATQSKQDYNFDNALYAIFGEQKTDGSFGSLSDSYYVSPLMNRMSLLNSSNSCSRKIGYDATEVNKTLAKASRLSIKYTIQKFDGKTSTANTMSLYVPEGSSFYAVIEFVRVLISHHKVQYNVVDGKPYVSAVNDLQEDLERGFYWYTYLRPAVGELKLMRKSPVDVEIQENDELILWYK